MSINKNNSVNSFFGFPPPLEEDHFPQAFHQTLCVPSSSQTPTSFTPNNPSLILNPFQPITVSNAFDDIPLPFAGNFAGERRFSGTIDLMSCTESLGFESSDEMITSFDDLGFFNNKKSIYNNNKLCSRRISSNKELSSSSSCSCSCCCSSKCRISRRREKMVSKSDFPPPLTTLRENGRRNFMLKSERKDGRLKISEVMIERPEILRASRENGRLRLHLIQDVVTSSDDVDEEEQQVEETEEIDLKKMPALRRCYDHHNQIMWGPHQHRCVTTI